jgi:hypothetical protein
VLVVRQATIQTVERASLFVFMEFYEMASEETVAIHHTFGCGRLNFLEESKTQ